MARLAAMPPTFIAALGTLLCLLQAGSPASGYSFNGSANQLDCEVNPILELEPECRPLVVFNQREWSLMAPKDAFSLARHCACQIVNLNWEDFDEHPAFTRIREMVRSLVASARQRDDAASKPSGVYGERNYPSQVWSDTEIIVHGHSVSVSMRDYLAKLKRDPKGWRNPYFSGHKYTYDLNYVCHKVARDRHNYYQYLENLQRIEPNMFFSLLKMNEGIDLVYQASKACKLMFLHRLADVTTKPLARDFYAPENATLEPFDLDTLNELTGTRHSGSDETFNEALRDASAELLECPARQRVKLTPEELGRECPMMLSNETSWQWFEEHQEPAVRSEAALKCGCQLLLQSSGWRRILLDKNVEAMSDTLTDHMKSHPLPKDSGASRTSALLRTREYFGWFESIMQKFAKSKKVVVKAMVKMMRKDEDPTREVNRWSKEEEDALEIARAACNLVMFNHVKGEGPSSNASPVTYLDNLRYLSQDPLFVFHLALQNKDLFRIYAISKMCLPVIR